MSRLLRTLLQNLHYTTSILRAPLSPPLSIKDYNAIKSLSVNKRLQYTPASFRCCSNTSRFGPSELNNNKIDDDDHTISDNENVLTCVVQKTDDLVVEDGLDHLLPSQRQKHYNDFLVTKVYDCQTASELFDTHNRYKDVMKIRHLLAILRQLSNLVWRGDENGLGLQETRGFQDLCREVYVFTRQMEHDEVLEVLKHLCRLEVSSQSKLVQSMLKHYINDLDLRQLVFLEFLLKKMPATTLSDALQTALPVLIDNSLKEEPLQHLSLMELSQILSICVRGTVRNLGVILQEIYTRGSITKASSAVSIIWSLTDMYVRRGKKMTLSREDNLTREVLIKECLEAIARDMTSLNGHQVC
ncbi:hypothetical protein Hamer_G012423 [Homarus americanus]|uniref:Uncharacterized protein n=1 Tax=Homarus americanus TaxID=6706 RepID=A0A8J5KBY1_HOMAM|nr:hypothetical protein Hamer_G012423 [Homarus americanus]